MHCENGTQPGSVKSTYPGAGTALVGDHLTFRGSDGIGSTTNSSPRSQSRIRMATRCWQRRWPSRREKRTGSTFWQLDSTAGPSAVTDWSLSSTEPGAIWTGAPHAWQVTVAVALYKCFMYLHSSDRGKYSIYKTVYLEVQTLELWYNLMRFRYAYVLSHARHYAPSL